MKRFSPLQACRGQSKVIFAATENLGPHRFQGVSTRQEYRVDKLELESTEVMDQGSAFLGQLCLFPSGRWRKPF